MVFSRDELKQFEQAHGTSPLLFLMRAVVDVQGVALKTEFPEKYAKVKFVIGDVRDEAGHSYHSV